MLNEPHNEKIWQDAVAQTPDCLSLETLEGLTGETSADPRAARHLSQCAHCQTELALLKSFESAEPAENEGAAVSWIAAQLEKKQFPNARQAEPARPVPFWRMIFSAPRLAGAAAFAVIIVLGVSIYLQDHSGQSNLNHQIGHGTFRSENVNLTSPSGDLQQAPQSLEWQPYAGATSYLVAIKEVDGTVMWSGRTTDNKLAVSPGLMTKLHPGKPLTWTVTALDANGNPIGVPGEQHFKIMR